MALAFDELEGISWSSRTIEKPQTDHREYRPLLLENGLRAVLVSDSKCDKSAAALSVHTGSLFDPKEVQGLAHFCEHMLFLGTEKYPREDEYNEYLAKHGGMSNAYTAEAVTNFFFGVSPDHLVGALDRFAQFFISPLFTESATDRELRAVDSEHSKNRQSDGWRWGQLLKGDANPKHPMSHFGTGNYDTLKTIPERDGHPVRQRLLEFHEQYYSANVMCFSILGKESLDELEALVRTNLGPVVNKNTVVPSSAEVGGGEATFLFDGWPRLVRVVPVRDVRSMSFQFVLPQQMPMRWRTKPAKYLSFLIGHEGKGSLLSALKAQGLATELMAGPSMDEAGVCVFEVGINLTEMGESKVRWVGELVFAYINLLQQVPVSEELFRETQCIEEMNFRFRSVTNQIATVSSIAHSMQDNLPIEKVFSGPAKAWDLDKEQIAEVASGLICCRLRVVIAAKAFEEGNLCTETETWYGTRFGAGPLPEDWHSAWEARRKAGCSAEEAVAVGAALGLALPMRNPFVAEDLDLKPRPDGGVPKYPQRVAPLPEAFSTLFEASSPAASSSGAKGVLQVYYRQDDKFDLPKACLNVTLYCPWCAESLENRCLTSAWCQAVMEELNELAYDADVAGLFYVLSGTSRGIVLRLAGYQDKLPVLLRTITEKMASMKEVSEHTWGIVNTVMLRNAKNSAKNKQPYHQAVEWERRCLDRTATSSHEMLEIVQGLTLEKLQGVGEKLLHSCYCEALLQGNVAAVEVGKVLEAVLPTLRPVTALRALPALAVGALPDGPDSCVLVRRDGTNPEEQNGAVTVCLQAAPETLANTTMAEVAAQVLHQRCFDELRTKQQLGYIVALQAHADGTGQGFCGLKVIVQSERHPAEVHRLIDAWLAPALETLVEEEQTSDEKLAEYLEALLALKREKPKKLADEFGQNWSEVQSRNFRFTRRAETVEFLERSQKELISEFRAFVRERLLHAPRFAVEVLGAAAAAKAAEATPEASSEMSPYEGAATTITSIGDVEAFRERLAWCESNTMIGIDGV